MKILVTGATGFIGNYVTNELLKRKKHVIATSSNRKKAQEKVWFNKVTFIEHRIDSETNQDNLFKKFNQPDLLIHLAWEGLPNYKSSFHLEKNLPAQYTFLKNLIENGLSDVTITGTCFEYGMKTGMLSENMKPEPENSYGKAKNELREKLEWLQKQKYFTFRWVRLFYLYGKGQNPKSLLAQLDTALENNEAIFNMSGGKQIRDYLPVEKAAKYIVEIALQKKITGIINCSSNRPITVKEVVQEHLAELHKEIQLNTGYYPYPDFEPMEFWGDNSKLNQIINNEQSE